MTRRASVGACLPRRSGGACRRSKAKSAAKPTHIACKHAPTKRGGPGTSCSQRQHLVLRQETQLLPGEDAAGVGDILDLDQQHGAVVGDKAEEFSTLRRGRQAGGDGMQPAGSSCTSTARTSTSETVQPSC